MIKVELTFPDQAALLAFFACSAPVASAGVTAAEKAAVLEVAPDPKPKAEKTAPAADTKPAAASEPSAAAAPSAAPAPSPFVEVAYPELQKAVFALAQKSRDAAAEVAASFKVKTFKDLPADRWADALAAVKAKAAELEAKVA